MNRSFLIALTLGTALAAAGCGSDPKAPTGVPPDTIPDEPVVLSVAGQGEVLVRFTGEVWVRGSTAYT
ncbi:MAG: hypothetical protein ACREOG_11850, partial [Gemmatimonadaceae bacterium]